MKPFMASPFGRLNDLLTRVVLLLVLLAFASVGQAQVGGAFAGRGDPNIRATLVAETNRAPAGSTVTLALVMRPEAGWHGYWENPGDAGQGMRVEWEAPAELARQPKYGPFRYPVPERLVIAGLMNHVFEHEYAVLLDVTLPKNLEPGTVIPIRGQAQWLACTDTICVPEQGEVATTLTVGNGEASADSRQLFDRFRAALPRPLDQDARYAISGDTLTLAVPYPAAAPVGEPWFFASTPDRVRYAEPQRARRNGDWLVIDTALAEDAAQAGPIEGVLALTNDVALQIRALPGAVPTGGEPLDAASAVSGDRTATATLKLGQVLLILGGAFLGGLILNILVHAVEWKMMCLNL